MPTKVVMPQLGESVVEGTVGHWMVQEGQPVKEYEPLLAVTTDKVDTEIPAPASGILLKVYVTEGQTVSAGTVLAEIGTAEESTAPGGEQRDGHAPAQSTPAPAVPANAGGATAAGPAETRGNWTPLAQRMAAEHGIDPDQVPGTGPGGKVTKEDIEAYLAATEGAEDREAPAREPGSVGFISPAVGRLAAEMGVDLAQVIGTGAGGRITKKDVLAYIATPAPRGEAQPAAPASATAATSPAGDELAPWERPGTGDLFKPTDEMGREEVHPLPPGQPKPLPAPAPQASAPHARAVSAATSSAALDSELVPMSTIRKSIAKHMLVSKQTSPHVTTVMEADLTRVVRARERLKSEFERQGARLTFTPFFVQAIVAGLKAKPEANSTFTEEGLLVHRRIHIGMAVAIPDGLIVPVIRDADERSLLGLARAVNDLAERGRTKKLAPEEVQGGTFTLTNHGTAGSLFATPIINQPQAGILGVGAIEKRAVVISQGDPLLPDAGDVIAIRPMAYLSFTFDHRVLDGQGADGFLVAVKAFLEDYSG
jgi:pyruvate/2-oxoglutarate dehydrogenase complex dihydrolipoamide acyltransferase (E2) component